MSLKTTLNIQVNNPPPPKKNFFETFIHGLKLSDV